MSEQVTRRQFLGTSGKAAATLAAGAAVHTMLRPARAADANEKFNVALIGCGGMGGANLNSFMNTELVNVVAVCDVDQNHLGNRVQQAEAKLGKKPEAVKDYRKVIDRKDVDVVIVATPDHWHAAPMIAAVAAGKDVYCEKPACHNIAEGRAMVDAAAKYRRIVQVGTHQRSAAHMQEARDFIRAGKLGTITMTETYTWATEAPDGMGNAPDEPSPEGLDYDMWLGAAPKRPFNRRRFHHSFRWYFDYASGMVGDWNVHLQDIIMWTLETPSPKAVSTSGGKFVLPDDRDTPDTMLATYEFGPGPHTPSGYVQLYTMRKASGPPWSHGGYGMVFHGTNGKLLMRRDSWEVVGDFKDWGDPNKGRRVEGFNKPGVDQHLDHVKNFLACVRSRQKPIASIEDHFQTVTACHLANVSLRSGSKIYWCTKTEKCYKDPELKTPDAVANQYVTREYRKGYELPKV